MKRKLLLSMLVLAVSGAEASSVLASKSSLQKFWGHKLSEIEVYSGYGFSTHPENYSSILLGTELGFSLLKNPKEKKNKIWEVEIGPFINGTTTPSGAEIGCDLLWKYGLKIGRWMPYAKVGTGGIFTSHRFREESTRIDFLVQGGVGISYFLNKKNSLNIEYRRRHFSNASLEMPNNGVNVSEIIVGISHYF